MKRVTMGAGAGVLVMLGFPPFEWTMLSWLGLVLVVWALATAPTARAARWTAYLFGVGLFGPLLYWLTSVELLAFYPLVLLQALPFVLFGAATFAFRDRGNLSFVVAAAGSFALADFARVRWPYGGFPWGSVGLTVSSTPLRPSSQWWGASGWTVLLLTMAALIVLSIRSRAGWQWPALGAGLVAIVAMAGNVWPAIPEGAPLAVAVVQGNSPCPGERCANERTLIYESHLALTRELEPDTWDLVVWPESSTGAATDPVQFPEVGAAIGAEARRLGAVVVVGGDRDAGPENFINANVVFDTRGDIIDEYRKQHPVPFGEYVPLRSLLDWIPALDRVPRDLLRGEAPVIFSVGEVPVASVISYEGAFARYERESVGAGADLVVVATNEASFGDTAASDQFLAISRLRAAELGIDIVHAAVTGRSALVHADGRVEMATDLFERISIGGSVAARSAGETLYAGWGDWLQVLASLAYLALWAREAMGRLPARLSVGEA